MFYNVSSLTTVSMRCDNMNSFAYMFYYCSALTSVTLLNIKSPSSTSSMFERCSSLTTAPELDLSKVVDCMNMFRRCSSLVSVPVYNLANANSISTMFTDCGMLSDASLNNIMESCITAVKIKSNKTLSMLGLTAAQATRCQSLSNWDAFVAAGWSS